MHLLLFIVLLIIVVVLYNQSRNAGGGARTSTAGLSNANCDGPLAYLSRGKLFLKAPGEDAQQVQSEYIQQMADRSEKNQRLHGWKENTSWGTSFAGTGAPREAEDKLSIDFTSSDFVHGENKLLYFLKDDNFGGLFEYDIDSGKELRLVHKQNLSFTDLQFEPSRNKILCATEHNNGISNIVVMDRDGSNFAELTAGDSFDTAPCWVDEHQVVYQSQGHARSGEGYIMAYGPASIQLLDTENSEVSPVLEDPTFDYLQPRVCSQGHLYYLRRPHKPPSYGQWQAFLDAVLFPFRLLRAIFHYLNFFSLMYSRKPLTSASGPRLEVDSKELKLRGMRIDAEKALKRERNVNGVPSLVPASWQLVRRDHQGAETVIASHVASFSIGDNDSLVYTNGCGIFSVTSKGTVTIARDNVVEEVIT